MAYYDGPEDSLAGNLDLVIGAYRDERQEYWADEPAESSLIQLYDMVAEALLSSSMDLVLSTPEDEVWKKPQSPWADIARLAEEQGFARHLAQSIEICIATESVDSLWGSTSRCLDLARYVLSNPLGEPVKRYLARLGRCYVAGFLPECVMLCRAVLENGIKDTFGRRGQPNEADIHRPMTMRQRLRAAEQAGWLTRERRRDAESVWLRGNTAVHDDPRATTDVFGTIVLTMGVLEQLYSDE